MTRPTSSDVIGWTSSHLAQVEADPELKAILRGYMDALDALEAAAEVAELYNYGEPDEELERQGGPINRLILRVRLWRRGA